jgi:6-pyruvoyltetrahydropterin/6-carboxytetrahydropterin synthase
VTAPPLSGGSLAAEKTPESEVPGIRAARICKSFTLEAAHSLPNHAGKCARLHGHSYRVEVEAAGEVKPATGASDEGMVLDFAELGDAWAGLHARLDHQFLNDVLPPEAGPTTAENLAAWMLGELRRQVPEVCAVRVYETAKSWAEVRA